MTLRNDSFYGCSIDKLNEYFQFLIKLEKDLGKKIETDVKLKIEKQKLAIMQAMLAFFQPKMHRKKSKKIKKRSVPEKIYYGLSTMVNPLIAGAGRYWLCENIFLLIPGMINPMSLILGVTFGITGGLISLGINAKECKKIMGISASNIRPVIKLYQRQISIAKKIKSTLLSIQCSKRHGASDYNTFRNTMNLFQQDIQQKNEQLTKCHEKSSIQKGIKYVTGGVHAVLSAGSGLFLGKWLLTLFAGAMIAAGPVGWVVGGAFAAFSLATFFYTERKGIYNLIDTIAGYPKKLIAKQSKFIKNSKKFERRIKGIVKTKSMNDEMIIPLKSNEPAPENKVCTSDPNDLKNSEKRVSQMNDREYKLSSVLSQSIFRQKKIHHHSIRSSENRNSKVMR